MQINHIMAPLQKHLDSVIRKRICSKNIDCGMKRFLSGKNDVKMPSQTLEELVPNFWTSEQPLVNIATGKKAPQEMVKTVKSLKQIAKNAMNEFIARLHFKKAILLKIHTMIALKIIELYHLSQTVTKKCQPLQKMKINFSVKFLHALITKRSIYAR